MPQCARQLSRFRVPSRSSKAGFQAPAEKGTGACSPAHAWRTPCAWPDELGRCKIIHVHEPSRGLKGTLVVDNVAIGPAIGGAAMAPDVSTAECFRLARAMTLKNAAASAPARRWEVRALRRSADGGRAQAGADPRHGVRPPRAPPTSSGPIWAQTDLHGVGVAREITRAVGLPREKSAASRSRVTRSLAGAPSLRPEGRPSLLRFSR